MVSLLRSTRLVGVAFIRPQLAPRIRVLLSFATTVAPTAGLTRPKATCFEQLERVSAHTALGTS